MIILTITIILTIMIIPTITIILTIMIIHTIMATLTATRPELPRGRRRSGAAWSGGRGRDGCCSSTRRAASRAT